MLKPVQDLKRFVVEVISSVQEVEQQPEVIVVGMGNTQFIQYIKIVFESLKHHTERVLV